MKLKYLLKTNINYLLCLQYDDEKHICTIGGHQRCQEELIKIFFSVFNEPQELPEFYSVTTNCKRMNFSLSIRQWYEAIKKAEKLFGEDNLESVYSFERQM